jgi:hypothetical protein
MTAKSWLGSHCVYLMSKILSRVDIFGSAVLGVSMKTSTYGDNGTASGGSRMRGSSNDVFTGEQPVTPAETADVVQALQVEDGGFLILDGIASDAELLRTSGDIGQELTMWTRSVGPEFMQDLGQGRVGHGYLQEVIEQRDL